MNSITDIQCAYVFATGKRRGQRCTKPKSGKDIEHDCYCSFHYKDDNRSKKSIKVTVPSDNEEEIEVIKKKLEVVLPIKKSVIEQLSPRTVDRFKERFEIEKARMLEDKLYREYKREMHYY